MGSPSILFIGKKDDFYCNRAVEFVRLHFPKHTILLGKRGECKETDLTDNFDVVWWRGDYIISYLSPWIIPESLLLRANKASINFHPGSLEYPGIGCANFAIYNESTTFGVTCHHMKPAVDTGNIISVYNFPVYKTDTVYSLTQKCYGEMLPMFYYIMRLVLEGHELPESSFKWKRKPYTRKELNNLCRILPDSMSIREMERRVKATTYPQQQGAYYEIGHMRFNYKEA